MAPFESDAFNWHAHVHIQIVEIVPRPPTSSPQKKLYEEEYLTGIILELRLDLLPGEIGKRI